MDRPEPMELRAFRALDDAELMHEILVYLRDRALLYADSSDPSDLHWARMIIALTGGDDHGEKG